MELPENPNYHNLLREPGLETDFFEIGGDICVTYCDAKRLLFSIRTCADSVQFELAEAIIIRKGGMIEQEEDEVYPDNWLQVRYISTFATNFLPKIPELFQPIKWLQPDGCPMCEFTDLSIEVRKITLYPDNQDFVKKYVVCGRATYTPVDSEGYRLDPVQIQRVLEVES